MIRVFCLTVILLFVFLSVPSFAQQDEEPVNKTYRIRFKTVQEFEPLVRSMLSNRGQIQTSGDLNVIVVFDRPAFLAQIDSLFYYFDVPAQQFMISIWLLLGSNDDKAQSVPDSTAIHEMLDSLYFYSKYEELDRVYIRTEEKIVTSFDLAEGQFNISLQVDYIPGAAAPVRFRQFILNELVRDISGTFLKQIYTSSGELREDDSQVFAAIKHETTGKTLILIVTASRI